ncbi:MAG TPA: hypothetical protein VEU08_03355 [Vicinamibacterales bacterium]|nr:hypothetical protein [Vicinamibacterales bacterium]
MKAAWFGLCSAICGFYLAGTAYAQQPPLQLTLDPDLEQALPAANSPFAILETLPPEVIADRFTAGGLNAATPPRFGALLNSWNQTQYRIGDVPVTDPLAGGTPMVLPDLALWPRMTIATGAMALDQNAPALNVTFDPRRPTKTWTGLFDGALSASPLVSGAGATPAINRIDQWQEAHAAFSGPLTDRVGLAAGGAFLGLSHAPAPGTLSPGAIAAPTTTDRVASGFAHLVHRSARDEMRALGLVQRVSTAAFTDTAVHAQSTWERKVESFGTWRAFAGYTGRSHSAPLPATATVDSVDDSSLPSDLFDAGDSFSDRWIAGARAVPAAGRRLPEIGVDVERAGVRIDPGSFQQIQELVDGAPARLWTVHASGVADSRHVTTAAAYGNEHVTLGRLTIDAGLRLDAATAAADAAASGIRWTSLLPRALVRWNVFDGSARLKARAPVILIAGYRRAAYQMPLNVLAVGDPAAPVADVARWTGTAAGPLIARVGPGTGGDASFARIDPNLDRPITDELVLAVESRPLAWLQLGAARITKREASLLQFVDTGVGASGYSSFQVPDVNFLPDSPVGRPQVTVFNRAAGFYGRDQYLLTNRNDDPAKSWGIELSIRATTERFVLLANGAFTWALGPAAAVGFAPTANDQDVLGSMFVDPNAATNARGQLFQDRSHTAKIAAIWRLPRRASVGAVLRYQDGQPFARLVVVPNLTQGPTAVRAYANGGSAFTYTGTLDVRAEKAFTLNTRDAAIYVDVFNAPGVANEASEHVVAGAAFRTPTTVQPPRTAVVGIRIAF